MWGFKHDCSMPQMLDIWCIGDDRYRTAAAVVACQSIFSWRENTSCVIASLDMEC